MPDFAVHNGVVVINVVVADSREIAEELTGLPAVETQGEPWIGWTLIDGEWVAPAVPEPAHDINPAPAPAE